MSLKSKIEAVIYASEEPVTLAQLVVLLSEEAQSELDALARMQTELPLEDVGASAEAAVTAPDAEGADEAAAPQEAGAQVSNEDPDAANAAASGNSDPEPDQFATSSVESIVPAESAESAEKIGTAEDSSQSESAPAAIGVSPEAEKRQGRERERAIRDYLRGIVDTLIREYADSDRGLEIREVAGGFRFGTKPEYHDAVRGFVKSLKPALKLSLQALETLAVVAYKQPVTAAEISEIRGVDSAGVLGGLLTRKLIQTAGRKQVIGRPMLYKTTKEFLVRFGLRDIQELPSMEEFERMAGELAEQEDLPMEATEHVIERANARGDAEHIRETNEGAMSQEGATGEGASPAAEAGQAPPSATETGAQDEAGNVSPAQQAKLGSEQPEASPRAEAEPASTKQDPA